LTGSESESKYDKIFFKAKDLSEQLGVEEYVLRYWAKEFPQIVPIKLGNKRNLYTAKHLEIFKEIKRLLHDERYTVAGARKRLKGFDPERTEESDLAPDNPSTEEPVLQRAVADLVPGQLGVGLSTIFSGKALPDPTPPVSDQPVSERTSLAQAGPARAVPELGDLPQTRSPEAEASPTEIKATGPQPAWAQLVGFQPFGAPAGPKTLVQSDELKEAIQELLDIKAILSRPLD
jgi:DNA-binding transcriptional MerR regulator